MLGAIAGGIIGNRVSDAERLGGTLIGAGVGGIGGLIIGHSIVLPGAYTRLESLRRRGRVGVNLAMGAAGMLAIAAVIEGFWSPSSTATLDKFVVGSILWAMVVLYLIFAGRDYVPPDTGEVAGEMD